MGNYNIRGPIRGEGGGEGGRGIRRATSVSSSPVPPFWLNCNCAIARCAAACHTGRTPGWDEMDRSTKAEIMSMHSERSLEMASSPCCIPCFSTASTCKGCPSCSNGTTSLWNSPTAEYQYNIHSFSCQNANLPSASIALARLVAATKASSMLGILVDQTPAS